MVSKVWLAVLFLLILYTFKLLRSWRTNYLIAKSTGFQVIPVPVSPNTFWWLVVNRFIIGALRYIPLRWRPLWVERSGLAHNWEYQYAAFKDTKHDTYITVSPSDLTLFTANPEIIDQITARHNDFPKPTWMYDVVSLYGPNLLASESHKWRNQRKIVSPTFTEQNNQIVWRESVRLTQVMLKSWIRNCKISSPPIYSVPIDTMRFSLHIICHGAFGTRMFWPNVEEEEEAKEREKIDTEVSNITVKGHEMTQPEATEILIDNIAAAIGLGPKILKWLPFSRAQKTYTAHCEWYQHMRGILANARSEQSATTSRNDLISALVRAGIPNGEKEAPMLDNADILGNAWVFLLAGHETTGSTIFFMLVLLATDPALQRRLQADLDAILGDRPPAAWDYKNDFSQLFDGLAGAVLKETLRLFPPVAVIPKWTRQPQILTLAHADTEGGPIQFPVPANTFICLVATAVHRNPKHWPHEPPSVSPSVGPNDDLEEFHPERWLLNGTKAECSYTCVGDEYATPDTAKSSFTPPKGAYIPFSYGHRSCIGKRFAQVEVLGVLAAVFKSYSVELAVDRWANDEQVAQMEEQERKEIYGRAREEVLRMLRVNVWAVLTLQLRDGKKIPLNFVRRGHELF